MPASADLQDPPRRILIYRLGSIGDTVVALPCLKFLRTHFADAERILLTNQPREIEMPLMSVIKGMGIAHRAIAYPVGERRFLRLAREIRALDADCLIYLAPARGWWKTLRDITFFRFCGLRRIVGASLDPDLLWCRTDPETGEVENEAYRLARLLAPLGQVHPDTGDAIDLEFTVAERDLADDKLRALQGTGAILALAPGAKIPAKDWGEQNWRSFLDQLAQSATPPRLLLIGGPEDRARADRLVEAWPTPTLNLCGALAPRESAAAMARADLFLGTDGGPMHLAAAAGLRCVALFGAYNKPREWYPLGHGHHILHSDQLSKITVEQTVQAVLEALPLT